MMKMSPGQQGRHRCSCGGLESPANMYVIQVTLKLQRVTQEGIMTIGPTSGAVDRSDNVTLT